MNTNGEKKTQELNEEELLKVTGGSEEATQGVVCTDLGKSECENYDECVYFKEGFHRGCLYKKAQS